MHAFRATVWKWWISVINFAASHKFSSIFLDLFILIKTRSVINGMRAERTGLAKFCVKVKYLSFLKIFALNVLSSWLSIGGSREQLSALGYFVRKSSFISFFKPSCNQGLQRPAIYLAKLGGFQAPRFLEVPLLWSVRFPHSSRRSPLPFPIFCCRLDSRKLTSINH